MVPQRATTERRKHKRHLSNVAALLRLAQRPPASSFMIGRHSFVGGSHFRLLDRRYSRRRITVTCHARAARFLVCTDSLSGG